MAEPFDKEGLKKVRIMANKSAKYFKNNVHLIVVNRLLATIDGRDKLNDHYKTALEFYSNRNNWTIPDVNGPPETEQDPSHIEMDGGDKAAKALKAVID